MSTSILLLISLLVWIVPTPIRAETKKTTPLVFQIDESLSKPKYVYRPYASEFKAPSAETKPNPPTPPARAKAVATPSTTDRRDNTATKFAKGQCTDYVARQVKVTWRGNANKWIPNAKAQGYTVDRTPRAGSILVTNESSKGHVAYIESVEGTKVTFSEWNYAGKYKKTVRTLDISNPTIKGVIHPEG